MADKLVNGLSSDWPGSGSQRLVPIQNQYQDRCALYSQFLLWPAMGVLYMSSISFDYC